MMGNFRIRINGKSYNKDTIGDFCRKDECETWKSEIISFLEEWNNPESFIKAQTSGSTGIPKIIQLSKDSMIHSARATCNFFDIAEKSNILLCLPASYIAGKMMLVRAIVSGCQLTAIAPTSIPLRDLEAKVDFAAITPHQLSNSLADLKFPKIKNLIVGGSPVSANLQEALSECNSRIFETYGMTETCSHIALRPLNGKDASMSFKTLPGVNIHLDERGCLVIQANYLSSGEIKTNDMVEITSPGEFRWLGRIDNVINSGGIKLHPEQIEKKLASVITNRFFITAIPDAQLGECLVLIIEKSGHNNLEETSLRNSIKKVLSGYERPKNIYFLDAFVLSSIGKILKKETLNRVFS